MAGTVTALGDGVDASGTGRRVWGFTGTGGGYVEQAIAPVTDILPLPVYLSAIDAVTLGSAGVVVQFGFAHAQFAPGETVLVRGVAPRDRIAGLAARAGRHVPGSTQLPRPRVASLRRLPGSIGQTC
ncbi:hypothetical protein [Streptomyces sp. NPDC056682]|uniref:hypothetical protein n=1 Tax=Streptomyces sp. NPDC056682 TaxID=3345909 RepID=UPI0036917D15